MSHDDRYSMFTGENEPDACPLCGYRNCQCVDEILAEVERTASECQPIRKLESDKQAVIRMLEEFNSGGKQ